MKIRKRPITAADDLSVNRCTFTPEDVAAFLSQIYELQGLGISLNENIVATIPVFNDTYSGL